MLLVIFWNNRRKDQEYYISLFNMDRLKKRVIIFIKNKVIYLKIFSPDKLNGIKYKSVFIWIPKSEIKNLLR